jgi:hypothetical protein
MILILIDEYTGFIWGSARTDDPIEACRQVDAGCGEHGCGESFSGRSGYAVYAAPDDFVVDDGQDPVLIAAAERLPLVAKIVTIRATA